MAIRRLFRRLAGGSREPLAQSAADAGRRPLEYPAAIELEGVALTLRLLQPDDREAILRFARGLPEHDLLFLRRDITRPAEVDAWIHDVESGAYSTLLAFRGDEVVGYATVATEGLAWTRHIAELRVLVAEEMRGKQLGRLLTQQAFGLARQRGLQKMVARMTTDQAAAIKVFGKLGFRKEAVLRSYVIDRRGMAHDLQIMTLDIAEFQARFDMLLADGEEERQGF